MGPSRYTQCRAVIWILNNRRFLFKTFFNTRQLSVSFFFEKKKYQNWRIGWFQLFPKHQRTSDFHYELTKNPWWLESQSFWNLRTKVLYKFRFFEFYSPPLGKWVYIQADNPKVSEADSNDHTTLWKFFQLWAIIRNRNWPQNVIRVILKTYFLGTTQVKGPYTRPLAANWGHTPQVDFSTALLLGCLPYTYLSF